MPTGLDRVDLHRYLPDVPYPGWPAPSAHFVSAPKYVQSTILGLRCVQPSPVFIEEAVDKLNQ